MFNEFCQFGIVDKNDGDMPANTVYKTFHCHLEISSYSCIVSSGTCDGGLALLLLLAARHLPHARLLLPPGAGHGPAEVRGGRQCRILTYNHPGQKEPDLKNFACLEIFWPLALSMWPRLKPARGKGCTPDRKSEQEAEWMKRDLGDCAEDELNVKVLEDV